MNNPSNLDNVIEQHLKPIEVEFQRASSLSQQNKFAEAIAGYMACLDIAKQYRLTLPSRLFVAITMNIAYCYADLGDWERTFEYYEQAENVLLRNMDFIQKLCIDLGVTIMVFQEEDPRPQLAALYQSVGLSFNSRDIWQEALECFNRSLEISIELRDWENIVQTWHHVIAGSEKNEVWGLMQHGAERVLDICLQTKDKAGQVYAHKRLSKAYMEQGMYAEMLREWQRMLKIEKQIGSPKLAKDKALLREMRSWVKKKRRGKEQ
jgi:tetratricopeptide (TPR) repeat protein